MNLKKIGDELTDAELNTYISLLVHHTSLNEKITIKPGIVNGDYAKYTFDLSSASIVDNGILITNKTLADGLNVVLSDCFNASYELNLTVVRFGEINILDENTDETILNITIPLIKDEIVDITSIGELEEYDVISFDASIKIKHDKPVIIGNWVTSLTLGSNRSVIQGSETATLTVTATDIETLPVVNKDIKIYDNSTLLDTITTGTDGTATKTITNNQDGGHNFQAKYKSNVTSEILTIDEVIFYDEAIKDNHRQDWTDNGISVSYPDDNSGTVITESSGSAKNYVANYTAEDNRIIEFDIMGITVNTIRFYYGGGDNYLQSYLGDNSWHHVKVICDNGTITPYIDGTSGTVRSMTTNTTCRFILNNSSVKFKNFKIYEL